MRELIRRADSEIVGLRVGIKNGGCAGQSYTVEYAHDIRPTDEVVEDKGVKILVDPKAVLFLLGTEMDYKVDKMSATVRLQQSEPDQRLRLRRVGATDAPRRSEADPRRHPGAQRAIEPASRRMAADVGIGAASLRGVSQ